MGLRITVVSERMIGKKWTQQAHEQLAAEYADLFRGIAFYPCTSFDDAVCSLFLNLVNHVAPTALEYRTASVAINLATNPRYLWLYGRNRKNGDEHQIAGLPEELVTLPIDPIATGCTPKAYAYLRRVHALCQVEKTGAWLRGPEFESWLQKFSAKYPCHQYGLDELILATERSLAEDHKRIRS